MSSGSGDEEFYDAQDVTPVRQNRLLSACSLSEGESLHALEKEERRLLERRRIIEESRQKEEEEIQKKLASLDRKRQKEIEKQEAARKATENEQRRKKLEDIRLFMSDESTPDRPSPAPFIISTALEAKAHDSSLTDASGDFRLKGHPISDDIIEEKLEALSFELEQSGHLNRGDFSRNKSCDIHRNDSIGSSGGTYFQGGLDRTMNSFESDCFEDAASEPLAGSSSVGQRCCKSSSLNNDLSAKQGDVESNGGDDARLKSSSLPVQLSVYPCEMTTIDLVQKPVLQEPDIIQSTKSLPRQPQYTLPTSASKPEPATNASTAKTDTVIMRDKDSTDPIVPPRKKKSLRNSSASEKNRDSDSSRLSTDSDNLSMTAMPPSRPGGYRPSLDLSAATQGSCHVVATEDAAAKGDNQAQSDNAHMDTLKEEDLISSTKKDKEIASCSDDEDDDDDSLDVLVHREDSLVEEQAPTGQRNSSVHTTRPDMFNLARQKSKTLAGSASEELRKTRDSYTGSKVMTDKEILEQVMVTNLDTGEKIPLSDAENRVPSTMNPLSLHIMRLTKEYSSDRVMPKSKDEAEKDGTEPGKTVKTLKVPKKRGKKIKKFLSKSVRKIKSELKSMKEDRNSSSDEDEIVDGRRMIKIKASHSHKGPYDFDLLVPVQNLAEDSGGAVWTMKFSHCGRLLATGGQDNILKIWVLKSGYAYFDGMRQKYSEAARVSPTPSQDSQHSLGDIGTERGEDEQSSNMDEEDDSHAPFMRRPFCVYKGHTADLLDVSWSKNYFILSSSMDKTVRLWHVSRKECLCCFQHIDFVTAIAFHPKDDRYFLSGSLDGKLRLWSIPEKKVALWNEVSGQSKLITAANFCTDGKIAVGTYDGRCVLYTADHLDYFTQIHVRSTRGKNAKGGKITGVDPYPGENKILVTSNDSRVRLYDLRDKTLTCKYKGPANSSSRIKASFNHDGSYIICGSEDGCVYIWRTQHDFYKFYSVRRDRNDFWEGVKAHVAVVTAAIFAPEPSLIIRPQFQFVDADDKEMTAGVRGEVVISADFNGAIKVFINKFKPGSG